MSVSRLLSNLRKDRKPGADEEKDKQDRREGKVLSQEGGWGF